MTLAAILDAVHARGVTLEPTERGTLKVRPGLASLTPELLAEIRAAKPALLRLLQAPDPIAAYKATLDALWSLGAQGADADPETIRHHLAEQARLCDDLGPEFAAAVSRQASREWARREQRCPFCGVAGVYHDSDSGEEIALEPTSEHGVQAGPVMPVDATRWPAALPGLGSRRPGPFSRCIDCETGTSATFGNVALCRDCARRRGGLER